MQIFSVDSVFFSLVYKVLEELKYKHYHSQMDKYLQLFHHRPVAAALYRKVIPVIDKIVLTLVLIYYHANQKTCSECSISYRFLAIGLLQY